MVMQLLLSADCRLLEERHRVLYFTVHRKEGEEKGEHP